MPSDKDKVGDFAIVVTPGTSAVHAGLLAPPREPRPASRDPARAFEVAE